jgi:hypothetical protein
MNWQFIAGGFIGGLAGAATRDLLAAVRRSDWLFRLGIRSDVKAIARAQRRKANPHGKTQRWRHP